MIIYNVEMVRRDWIILVLECAGKKGLTPVQLQKSLFLISKAFPRIAADFYNFQPYNYGPFDVEIYDDADELSRMSYIEKKDVVNQDWKKYFITIEGKKYLRDVVLGINKKVLNYVIRLVTWMQSLTFQELVASIYEAYPEYKVNSVFRNNK